MIANSIGAFFAMSAIGNVQIEKAFFVSPIVNMEKLIVDMMQWSGVTEAELKEKQFIKTGFGEVLSWEYLSWVRNHPIQWNIPTYILYGSADNLQSIETINTFANTINANLTIMDNGEHWFHTDKQNEFLKQWIFSLEK